MYYKEYFPRRGIRWNVAINVIGIIKWKYQLHAYKNNGSDSTLFKSMINIILNQFTVFLYNHFCC